ncbi:MAG: diacylglycerol kinase family lipid kinase, partial [Luteolibacter sp.]
VLGEQPPKIEVICADGRREEGVAVLTGNGALYGGPFKFFRNANNHDSKLDVLVYKESGYKLVLDSLRGLATGGIDLMASTSCFQAEEFTVRADREVPVQVDGELVGRFSEIHFVESRNRLRVIAPEEPLVGGFADTMKSLLHWPRAAEVPTAKSL